MLRHLEGKRVCVTGATGFLGGHLLPRLIAAGARARCLVRPQSLHKKLPDSVETRAADLATGEGLASALADQDILIHLAGCLFAYDWQDYLRANAQASQNLLRALSETGMRRVVFVSSLACAGPCANPRGVAEDVIPSPVSAYGWSKLLSERILAGGVGENLVIIRPPIIYGSRDLGLLPLFKSVKMGFGVSPGAFRKFPVSAIHANDCADAVLLATSPKASGIYHLNDGAVYDMDIICKAMGKALGKRILVAHPPLSLMAATAALGSGWGLLWRETGKRPPNWNLDKFREARQCGWVADATRVKEELGFSAQLDLDAGMREAVAGYRAEGWL